MTSKLRKILFLVLLIGIAPVSYRYMIKPANERMAKQQEHIQGKLAKLARFEKATSAASSLNEQLKQLEEAIVFFERAGCHLKVTLPLCSNRLR